MKVRIVISYLLFVLFVTVFTGAVAYVDGTLVHDAQKSYTVYGWDAIIAICPMVATTFIALGGVAALIGWIIKGGMK